MVQFIVVVVAIARDLDRQMVKDGTSKTVQTARLETIAKDSSDRQTVKAGRSEMVTKPISV